MKRDQRWKVGTLLISGAVLAGGYFLGIAPLLTQAALADDDRVAAETQATAYKTTLVTLKEKYANIDALKADLAAARATIPAEAEMSTFVGGLDVIAQATGAQVLNVTVADALPYVPPIAIAPVAPEALDDPGTSAAAAPVEAAPVVSNNPMIPNANLVSNTNMAIIPVTISVTGSFDQNMAFVGSLQKGERIFLVTRLATTEDTGDAVFTTQIEGYVYVILTADAAAALPSTEIANASG